MADPTTTSGTAAMARKFVSGVEKNMHTFMLSHLATIYYALVNAFTLRLFQFFTGVVASSSAARGASVPTPYILLLFLSLVFHNTLSPIFRTSQSALNTVCMTINHIDTVARSQISVI